MTRQAYVQTGTVLDTILAHKAQEVAALRASTSPGEIAAAARAAPPPRDMLSALRRDTVSLIAEVKHASPSRGVLIEAFDPVGISTTYVQNGAAAVSVLTDERFFQGSLDDLAAVRRTVDVPVLRKDFVIDEFQVYQARAGGADAVLLIVAALEDGQLAALHELATELGMATLVEVHTEDELERALRIQPRLLGINNRDLKAFDVDLAVTERLASLVPPGTTLVGESGVFAAPDVARLARAGVDAVLVGEALITAEDTAAKVSELSGVKRVSVR